MFAHILNAISSGYQQLTPAMHISGVKTHDMDHRGAVFTVKLPNMLAGQIFSDMAARTKATFPESESTANYYDELSKKYAVEAVKDIAKEEVKEAQELQKAQAVKKQAEIARVRLNALFKGIDTSLFGAYVSKLMKYRHELLREEEMKSDPEASMTEAEKIIANLPEGVFEEAIRTIVSQHERQEVQEQERRSEAKFSPAKDVQDAVEIQKSTNTPPVKEEEPAPSKEVPMNPTPIVPNMPVKETVASKDMPEMTAAGYVKHPFGKPASVTVNVGNEENMPMWMKAAMQKEAAAVQEPATAEAQPQIDERTGLVHDEDLENDPVQKAIRDYYNDADAEARAIWGDGDIPSDGKTLAQQEQEKAQAAQSGEAHPATQEELEKLEKTFSKRHSK